MKKHASFNIIRPGLITSVPSGSVTVRSLHFFQSVKPAVILLETDLHCKTSLCDPAAGRENGLPPSSLRLYYTACYIGCQEENAPEEKIFPGRRPGAAPAAGPDQEQRPPIFQRPQRENGNETGPRSGPSAPGRRASAPAARARRPATPASAAGHRQQNGPPIFQGAAGRAGHAAQEAARLQDQAPPRLQDPPGVPGLTGNRSGRPSAACIRSRRSAAQDQRPETASGIGRQPTRPAAAAENGEKGPEKGPPASSGAGNGTGSGPGNGSGLHFFQDQDRERSAGRQRGRAAGPPPTESGPGRAPPASVTFAGADRGAPPQSERKRPRTPQSRSATSIRIWILDLDFGG